ncbi:protein ENHANCED DOWNY MILDEW 2-like isoform X2 [Primulina eburnea]|uniref:protein ENHANCED DOWNY MILDEW 2-like isoform X2 n=1 Tax=Primulina eburnea TaxID=1245227 RepID=UPI003C6CC3AB
MSRKLVFKQCQIVEKLGSFNCLISWTIFGDRLLYTMAPPDEADKTVPCSVSDYEFVVDKDAPISFDKLPLYWNDVETPSRNQKNFFLRGTTDRRNRNIYNKQVIAWRFDISFEKPTISVFSKQGCWIKLLKPRKSYAKYVRKILITVHTLHFMKWNPKKSWRALWDHLSNVLSISMCQPSVDDLVDHFSLITETVKRDETLAKCEHLVAFLKEKPRKMKPSIKRSHIPPKRACLVKDEVVKNDDNESGEDDVCAICDNGGRLLICEGKCLRSFHPTVEDGADSSCPSLGYSEAEYEAIEKVEFYCKNCELKQHQCFGCGNLGSSDELSGAEVFRCVNGACGHFYHPHCVAKLLHPGDEAAAEEHRKKIAEGKQFACPRHICDRCKELEVSAVDDLRFAICRRCPRSYHRKCLPRKIVFEKDVDLSKGIVQRAWEGLIPNNRILIYCLKHDIDLKTSTPVRNHIKFPVSEPVESARGQSIGDELENTRNVELEPIVKMADNSLNLYADKKKRILTVMKNASSSATLEKLIEKHKAQSSPFSVDFTSGKVECSVEAVRAALQKLEGGGSVHDAKTFCGTDILFQVMNWKIVNKLHWYVQDGDMVVDFCCGSNDFSCFMKKKLNEVGKSCSFKNYDILQAKNDFNFERKDWVEVRPDVILEGSRLIMGLHPPSGTDGDLDDKFIKKALEFKPKLLILIAPRGTQRLDNKDFPYDLIWEDDKMFMGNSFYIPGSVDVSGEQLEDLNVNAPILHLWSSPDWTQKHKAIAKQHGHLSETQTNPESNEKQDLAHVDDSLVNFGEVNFVDNIQQTLEQETMLTTKEDGISYSSGSVGEKNRALACENDLLRENPNMFSGVKRKTPPSNMVSDENRSNSSSSHSISDPSSPNGKIARSSDSIPSKASLTNGSKEPKPQIRVRPLGFASGPCLPFPPQNSAGWLEE